MVLGPVGRDYRDGNSRTRTFQKEFFRKNFEEGFEYPLLVQHASHTFGGRRIEPPRGGTPPPTLPSGRSRPNFDVDVDGKANVELKAVLA